MPSWSGTLDELQAAQAIVGSRAFDQVRKKYMATATQITGRATILYGTNWTSPDPSIPPGMLSINDGDLQGLMEVVHGVNLPNLDLILHSPGGGIDAAAALVYYLRSKFTDIRVVVPSLAMSAAAMIACAGNSILMGKHSFLGPADPQFFLPTPLGQRQVAAQSVLAQFKKAQKECIDDPRNLAVWAPILNQYGPDLLVQAENATKQSKSYVKNWLESFMFANDPDRTAKAEAISLWLSSHENFNSHGTHIPREELRQHGITVLDLESNSDEQEVFLSIFHAMTHTMNFTGAVKIIENHMGRSYINQVQTMMVGQPANPAASPPPTAPRDQRFGPTRPRHKKR